MKRWRGLKDLLRDAVHHSSRAIERVQKETARRPFEIVKAIPELRTPAAIVHTVHDAAVTATHWTIRGVNDVVSVTLDVVIDVVEAGSEKAEAATAEPASDEAGAPTDRLWPLKSASVLTPESAVATTCT